MKEKTSKILPYSSFTLQKKFLIIAVLLFVASLILNYLNFFQLVDSLSLPKLIAPLLKAACYIILVVLFRNHLEILLLPLIYSLIQMCSRLFLQFYFLGVCGIVIEFAFIVILILSLYKNISPKVTKTAVAVRFAFCIVRTIISFISYTSGSIGLDFLLNRLDSIVFATAFFVIFFFAKKQENKGVWAQWAEIKLTSIIIGIILGIVVLVLLFTNDDETVTYYLDYNGNGKEDWGEAQFYEDKDGNTHWLD